MKKKETINNRVKAVRKALDMTQQEFAEKMKLKSGNTFSMIERGESSVTEQNIYLICTPNLLKQGKQVNYLWLKYGDNSKDAGEQPMFITPAKTDGLPKLFEDGKELEADEEELIGVYRDLIPDNKKYIRDTAKNIRTSQENMRKYMETVEEEEGKKDRRTDTSKKMN